MDQILAMGQVCEKYLLKSKDVFCAPVDVGKAHDRLDKELRTALRLYGLAGTLLKGVQSFYVNSRTCVRVGNSMSDWFPVRVGLCQGLGDVTLVNWMKLFLHTHHINFSYYCVFEFNKPFFISVFRYYHHNNTYLYFCAERIRKIKTVGL